MKMELNLECKICSASFMSKYNLSNHMKKHEGDKFACKHCGLKFLSKSILKDHVKAVHLSEY